MNFSLWPFLWFGLPGRLLKLGQTFKLPSDTKLVTSEVLLNYYFCKITNFIRNSLRKSFFPGDFKGAKSIKIMNKIFSGKHFHNNFVCQRVVEKCYHTHQINYGQF